MTGAGKRLLVKRHRLKVKLRVTQVLAGTSSVRAAVKLVSTQTLTF